MADIETYHPAFFAGVKALWEEAFPNDPPWNRAEVVIPAKMASQPNLFLVARAQEQVVGAALAGYDGHRGWLYSVAVRAAHGRQGIGSTLVRAMEARLSAMGCAKVNLQVLGLNMALVSFYHKLGYGTEDRISMGKRLSPLDP